MHIYCNHVENKASPFFFQIIFFDVAANTAHGAMWTLWCAFVRPFRWQISQLSQRHISDAQKAALRYSNSERNRPACFFVVNNLYLLDWGRWSEFGHLSEGSKGFKEAAASQWFNPARLLLMPHIYFPSRASVRLGHQSLLLSFAETPRTQNLVEKRKKETKKRLMPACPHCPRIFISCEYNNCAHFFFLRFFFFMSFRNLWICLALQKRLEGWDEKHIAA